LVTSPGLTSLVAKGHVIKCDETKYLPQNNAPIFYFKTKYPGVAVPFVTVSFTTILVSVVTGA